MKLHLLFILLVSISYSAFSQNPPKVIQRGNQTVEITNLMGKVSYMVCKFPSLVRGTIIKKWYEDDQLTIAGFIISDAKDNRKSINLNNEQIGLLGHYSVETISSLIKNGKKLQVWTYECNGGGSGVFMYASRIKAL